ncbi:ubiquitin carboxyl-terminal hydrolase-like protein 22 [Delitschia confertaspora ATCC 74209]|uniref:Ubiquitin carboxyl-terminal hydrolase-like protein 22 n=1 Tax=Delitschia confertaspora ATCC 74209 TaxID=1513339 RepID=A0A9P4JJ27_9PLEO|nr:ubiquitin carboxyl-terminal hydrolase-like protein 22 [Delitschia confertaspora ATCC 74209]
MDTISATKAAPLASPKNFKNAKGGLIPNSQMAYVEYGCEHMRELLGNARKAALLNYQSIVQNIHEKPSIIAQTHKNDGRPVVSLRPLYLCLQCPNIMTEVDRDQHIERKLHCFSVDSRDGSVYCGNCLDFIYDPNLEPTRLQRGKKRKYEDDITTEEHKLIIGNSQFLPCRATGLRGLYNMGQTCFMSVILQTLIHNPFIRSFYLGEGHKTADCEKEACVSCALDEMFVEFYSVEKTEGYGPVSMLLGSWMAAQALAGYQQQDAHEYMQFMLNALHQQNGGASYDSSSADCTCVIHQTFYGKLSSTVTCDKCRNVTTAEDPYMDLSLDIRSQAKRRKADPNAAEEPVLDLRDCLDRFTGREKLAAAEYTCRKCESQQNATKQLSIKQLPPVLAIHLKRFEHHNSASNKLETPIKFPMKLDLYPYTTEGKASQSKSAKISSAQKSNPNINTASNISMYELSTVVVHKGKIDSGHYVSYSREGNDWFMFDDSKVVLVSEAEVLAAEAYLLFYMVSKLEV